MQALRTGLIVDPDIQRKQEAIGLRSFTLPYAHAPRTWVMEVDGAALLPSRPTASKQAIASTGPLANKGFWNDMPVDELREPVLQMEPTYGRERKREMTLHGVDLREVAMFVCLTYLVMGLSRVAIMFMCYAG